MLATRYRGMDLGIRKPIGRPRVDATPINLRLPPADLRLLDTWIAGQPEPQPTRPEAVRRLLRWALGRDEPRRGQAALDPKVSRTNDQA